MADADDEPQFNSLAERIAALNKQKNFTAPDVKQKKPPTPGIKHSRPPPPPPPTNTLDRSNTLPVIQHPHNNGHAPPERQTPLVPPRPNKAPAPPPRTAPPPPSAASPPSAAPPSAAPPPPSAEPPRLPSRKTFPTQPDAQPVAPNNNRPAPPPLPGRNLTTATSPSLPHRPSTQQLANRRGSDASEASNFSSLSIGHGTQSSATSTHSAGDGPRKNLPPAYDPNSLPVLPPPKREREAQPKDAANKPREPSQQVKAPPALSSYKSTSHLRQTKTPQRPSLPPRQTNNSTTQPAQPPQTHVPEPAAEPAEPAKPPRRLPPPVIPAVKPRPETNGYHQSQQDHPVPVRQEEPRPAALRPPIPINRPQEDNHYNHSNSVNNVDNHHDEDSPPVIPLSSRPTFAQVEAASQPSPPIPEANDCLICRDFSGPDGVAAQHPRQSLPRNDPIGYLAQALCAPFSSYTDKARAIFTWFHHNIAYDCEAFFGNSVRARGGEETIFMGKAVCSGYADTYKAIAERAGLECVVVSGHGKGIGFTALKKGERPPPKKVDGHAWNSVRIDGGEWKLLDSCWGAGNVSSVNKQYTPNFKPHEFTRRNDVFGLSHYPKDERYFFRPDGRVPTWEEYVIGPVHGETPTVYTNAHQEGVWALTVEPKEKHIAVAEHVRNGEYVRFQFSKVCEHWTSEKNGLGKPPLLLLSYGGKKKDMVPMETDGFWWWADVDASRLGNPGEGVSVVMLQKLGGSDARGVSAAEFLSKRGKVGMSWSGILKWDLV